MQTPTAAAEVAAAVKKTLTSAAVTKCIADAVQAALAQAKAEQPGIHLVTFSKPLRFVQNTFAALDYYSADWSCNATIYRGHDRAGPHIYWGRETRDEANGRTWSSQTAYYVIDDFGKLVEVPA